MFIDRLNDYIDPTGCNILSISAARSEDAIETIDRVAGNPCQNTYSVSKFYASTALGLLYDRGGVRLDEKICEILADYVPETGLDERWREATVENALQHKLGLAKNCLDIDINPIGTFGRDFLGYVFRQPLHCVPGTDYSYTDAAFYIISRIVTARTGMKADDYLWEKLLYRIGTQEMAWSHCPMGYPLGGTGLYTRSSDMARLGLLYLNKGLWRGERLLSEEWTEVALNREYGINALLAGNLYVKGGMYGQKLILLPEQHRAVAVQAYTKKDIDIPSWCVRQPIGDEDHA